MGTTTSKPTRRQEHFNSGPGERGSHHQASRSPAEGELSPGIVQQVFERSRWHQRQPTWTTEKPALPCKGRLARGLLPCSLSSEKVQLKWKIGTPSTSSAVWRILARWRWRSECFSSKGKGKDKSSLQSLSDYRNRSHLPMSCLRHRVEGRKCITGPGNSQMPKYFCHF